MHPRNINCPLNLSTTPGSRNLEGSICGWPENYKIICV